MAAAAIPFLIEVAVAAEVGSYALSALQAIPTVIGVVEAGKKIYDALVPSTTGPVNPDNAETNQSTILPSNTAPKRKIDEISLTDKRQSMVDRLMNTSRPRVNKKEVEEYVNSVNPVKQVEQTYQQIERIQKPNVPGNIGNTLDTVTGLIKTGTDAVNAVSGLVNSFKSGTESKLIKSGDHHDNGEKAKAITSMHKTEKEPAFKYKLEGNPDPMILENGLIPAENNEDENKYLMEDSIIIG